MTEKPTETIGRAKAVLVFGTGSAAKAVVTSVVVRLRRRSERGRLLPTGSVVFEPSLLDHLADTVLPAVDRIMELLGLSPRCFELSVVNLGAASAVDLGASVSGFSLDSPIFLALLSAGLKMPIRQDVAATGHIASPDGDIRAVENIPAKLAATAKLPGMTRFVYPALDADTSLETFAPSARERFANAVSGACRRVRPIGIGDVAELLREATSAEARALGALRSGFFSMEQDFEQDDSALGKAILLLGSDNGSRFWRALESRLRSGQSRPAKRLLKAWTQHHTQRNAYPRNFGLRLSQLVASLPPATRRISTAFPILPVNACVELGRCATETDDDDVHRLFAAASGKGVLQTARRSIPASPRLGRHTDVAGAVDAVLREISAEALARKIGNPIDAARGRYVLPYIIVGSHEEYLDTVCAFYLALAGNGGDLVSGSEAHAQDGAALALVNEAFADRGGEDAAETEARQGTNGGMRLVFDLMTERYKAKRQFEHVNRVLKESLDPRDWDARVAFMAVLLKRLSTFLPEELRSAPPQRFVRHLEPIVRTYVRSLDRVGELLRTL